MLAKRQRKFLLVPALLLMALLLAGAAIFAFNDATPTSANPLAGPDFQIDGDTQQATPPASTEEDWDSVILDTQPDGVFDDGPGILIQDGNSGPKSALAEADIFAQGGKFGDPAGWTIQPGNSPAQNDLTNIYVYPVPQGSVNGDVWMVMGMHRIKKQGTFDLDFEFNQNGWDGASGTLMRTTGDIVVAYELSGNPSDPEADLQIVIVRYDPVDAGTGCNTAPNTGVVYGGGFCELFRGTATELDADPRGLGAATMNATAFDQPPWGAFDTDGSVLTSSEQVEAFFFAEAAINLTALGVDVGCPGFGSVHAKSRSSLEVTADLKDLAGPESLNLDCSLSGHKYEDDNGNGDISEDTGNPISGWTINLYEDDGDGVFEPTGDDAPATSTTTDGSGFYEFSGLSDGDYWVQEACPSSGWIQTFPTPDSASAADCGTGVIGPITIDIDNQNSVNNDFGNFELGTKSGHKYEDDDGDGDITEDTGNPLSGWTIELYKDDGDGIFNAADGSAVDTDTTDASGKYEFTGIGPGVFHVVESCPAAGGWIQTAPAPASATEADCGTGVHTVTVTSGFSDTDNDFGNFKLGTKSGFKYNDLDADGDLTDSVVALDGWTIQLYDDSGATPGSFDTGDVLLSSTTTADGTGALATGQYEFTGLGPGVFHVVEVCKTGWIQTVPTPDSATEADCGTGVHTITVTSSFNDTDNNFGNAQLYSKVVYTCNQANDTLVQSEVTENSTSKTTIVNGSGELAGAMVDIGGIMVNTADLEDFLCTRLSDGFAEFTDQAAGTYSLDVEVPDVP